MKPHKLALLLSLNLSVITTSAFASEATNANTAFSQAYQNYLSAVDTNENIQQAAKLAYSLGAKVYGDNADNTANLAINYAKAISGFNQEDEAKRYELYKQAYNILANNHGESSVETIDALLGMASNTKSARQADSQLERIVDIAKELKKPRFVADMQFAAASLLVKKFVPEKYRSAKYYAEEADEYYQANLPENAVERIKSDFLMASFDEGRKKYDSAITRLNRIVTVFDNNLSYDHSAELSAHSKLIALYEKQGESEQATKHCLAIAKMVPWEESQEQTPLYRVNPDYPMGKARQGKDGSVVMEFEVDTAGFVKNVSVLDSNGGVTFEHSAKKAVEQWRYAPKFEDGIPVTAKTQVRLDFKINR